MTQRLLAYVASVATVILIQSHHEQRCIAFGLSVVKLRPGENFLTHVNRNQFTVLFSSQRDNLPEFDMPEDENDTKKMDEAEKLKKQAEKLREEIRAIESKLNTESPRRIQQQEDDTKRRQSFERDPQGNNSLKGKTVMVVGANGRLGSMVCRYLLRNNPQSNVVAAVHYVGEASTRGYGRLSYEVGAEDGIGFINPAWDSEDRNARFEFAPEMAEYNLQNLRVVQVELLDPVQCMTICEDVDSIIWCATDFNGNKPRAVASLNVAFLFRAVADPLKGRVEVEGLRNILGGLKNSKTSKRWQFQTMPPSDDETKAINKSLSSTSLEKPKDPISFVLVSTADEAFSNFETPLGSFYGLKRDGERIIMEEFPSLSHTVLRMTRFEDNFVEEGLDIQIADASPTTMSSDGFDIRSDEQSRKEQARRRINRRDAAKAAVDALTNQTLKGKSVDVWTAIR